MGIILHLTTFLYAGQHQLDLFHALCIFHLVGVVGFSIRSSTSEGGSDSKTSSMSKIALRIFYYGALFGFFISMIYVFSTAPHFGANPDCNYNAKYVIFGIDVSATNPVFRGLFLLNNVLHKRDGHTSELATANFGVKSPKQDLLYLHNHKRILLLTLKILIIIYSNYYAPIFLSLKKAIIQRENIESKLYKIFENQIYSTN